MADETVINNHISQWYFGTKEAYNRVETPQEYAFYFLTDTREILINDINYTDHIIFFEGLENRPAIGGESKIYLDTTTMTGYAYTGSAWITIIEQSVLNEVTDDAIHRVSGEAVKAFVDAKLQASQAASVVELSYDETTNTINYTIGEEAKGIQVVKVATELGYDDTTGNVVLKDVAGNEISTINIPLDNYVEGAEYDAENKRLVLHMTQSEDVYIPANEITKLYNQVNSNSVNMTIMANDEGFNLISLDINVSKEAGNNLVLKDDGLFIDNTTKMTKVDAANAGEIITIADDGDIKASGVKIGTATLAETPNENTAATEVATKTTIETCNEYLEETFYPKAAIRTFAEMLSANFGE